MYAIVASDLDGTLLMPDHRLSDFTKNTLKVLQEQKIQFIFATGRHHIDVAQKRDYLGIDAFMITSNGARVHDASGALIFSKTIPEELALCLAQTVCDHPRIYTHIYRGDEWLINREDPHSLSFFKATAFQYRLFDPFDFQTDDISKLYFTTTSDGYHEELVILKEQLEARFSDQINVAFSTPNCLEVMAGGVSKGSALQFVTKMLGYQLKDILAFGDGMNDYEMLSIAGKGCIMRNAPDSLKEQLPHLEIIGSNADESVPHYLHNLFFDVL